ncbi:glycosyltransferase family 2 protein [Natronoarchaeum sp. GCM10025321]|uniref:glycosyltransferase family 2 protein n=1 Tax=Natronoarchaeum sp. GCM10025321 TaxID=3252684 RepID=UPI003608CCEC
MYRDATVGVVVPAYNEEGFVGDVLRDIPDFVDRVYAIDDCSTDGTWSEILDAASVAVCGNGAGKLQYRDERPDAHGSFLREPEASRSVVQTFEDRIDTIESRNDLVAIAHTENFGAGGAIKTGYLAALVDGIDITVTIDADGQMDPRIMNRLVKPVVDGRVEYTKGTRLVDGRHWREMPPVRAFGNTVLTCMTKVASGYWPMTDSQNGYTAISLDALQRIGVENLFEYYAYCNAVLVRLNTQNAPIADVEVPTTYGEETSNIEISTFLTKVTPMLAERFLWRLRTELVADKSSLVALLYLVGVVCLLIGSVLLTPLCRLVTGRRSYRGAAETLGAGALSLTVAMVVERTASADLVEVVLAENHDGWGGKR